MAAFSDKLVFSTLIQGTPDTRMEIDFENEATCPLFKIIPL